MKEQSDATYSITDNISQAAEGIQTASANVSHSAVVSSEIAEEVLALDQTANNMSRRNGQVDQSAGKMSRMSSHLKELVGRFNV
jgi:methyl-accepting chemotaxis protein